MAAGLRRTVRRLGAPPAGSETAEHGSGGEVQNSIGMVLLPVPGGRFERGCHTCDRDSRPVRSIMVAPLLVGQYEVTVAQFKLFMRESGYRGARPSRGASGIAPANVSSRDSRGYGTGFGKRAMYLRVADSISPASSFETSLGLSMTGVI